MATNQMVLTHLHPATIAGGKIVEPLQVEHAVDQIPEEFGFASGLKFQRLLPGVGHGNQNVTPETIGGTSIVKGDDIRGTAVLEVSLISLGHHSSTDQDNAQFAGHAQIVKNRMAGVDDALEIEFLEPLTVDDI